MVHSIVQNRTLKLKKLSSFFACSGRACFEISGAGFVGPSQDVLTASKPSLSNH